MKTIDDYEQRRKKLNLLSLVQKRFLFNVLSLYKTLNGYINIYLSTYVQFFSDSDRYPCTLKKNYARTDTFKFSFFSTIVDMCSTLPLPIHQATTIASYKKGVREFLDGNNVWDIFYSYYYYFIDCYFFVHISVCIFTFLIVCLLNLVFMIWIFFTRCSVFYGVFDSFTDRT